MTGASDAWLIERSLTDPEAFGGIFDRHFDAVRAYLSRRVGAGRADDLAASVFVVAFERRASFRRDATTARPWLLGIATNLLRNQWRSERRALEVLARLPTSEHPTEAESSEDPELLASALAHLDADQRDVLLLYAWEELSYDEIAAALEVPVGTVRSRLARARSRLRAALGDEQKSGADATEVSG